MSSKMTKEKCSWDRGLDYEKHKKLLIAKLRLKEKRGVRVRRATAYLCALLFQLRNGSRISEAVDAVKEWAKTKKVEVTVRKHRNNPELRKMVVPEELKEEDRLDCASVLNSLETANVKFYASYTFGWNTHSLRYARITHLAKKGVSPSYSEDHAPHKRLDYVLSYTQQKTADELNREID